MQGSKVNLLARISHLRVFHSLVERTGPAYLKRILGAECRIWTFSDDDTHRAVLPCTSGENLSQRVRSTPGNRVFVDLDSGRKIIAVMRSGAAPVAYFDAAASRRFSLRSFTLPKLSTMALSSTRGKPQISSGNSETRFTRPLCTTWYHECQALKPFKRRFVATILFGHITLVW